MKHFLKVAQGIDVMPLLHALARKPLLWSENPIRCGFAESPHADVEDILLRFEDTDARPDEPDARTKIDAAPLAWTAAWRELPEVKAILWPLLHRVGAYELGRLMITKLRPGDSIGAHADTEGLYAQIPDMSRYHIALQGLPGSLFHVERETVQMLSGEAWLFDNRSTHSVVNNSADDRVHLIVDARIAP